MARYPNAIVYKIVKIGDETKCYIGSTVKQIAVRKTNHIYDSKRLPNRPLYIEVEKEGGWKSFEFKVIEEYPCDELRELRKREQFYVDMYKPSYNKNVSSTGIDFTGDYAEYSKEYAKTDFRKNVTKNYYERNKDNYKKYREINKDIISEQKKKHYHDNAEIMRQKKREYYEKQKEKILQQAQCECGCFVTQYGINRHQKSKKHITLMKIRDTNVTDKQNII